jgi:hypothetical protein
MTAKPLLQIRLRWSDHQHALWWLGLLYRRPRVFAEALEGGTARQKLGAGLRIVAHVVPYMVLLCVLGRLLLYGVLGLSPLPPLTTFADILTIHGAPIARWIAIGIAMGIAIGIAFGIIGRIARGIAFGIAGRIAMGIAFGIALGIILGISFLGRNTLGINTLGIGFEIARGIAFGILFGIGLGIAFGIFFGISTGRPGDSSREITGEIMAGIGVSIFVGITLGILFGIVEAISVGIAGAISFGISFGISGGTTIAMTSLRCYYNIIDNFLVGSDVKARWYPFHPVAWDDCCFVPFSGLDRLLAAYTELEPAAGNEEIERLIDHYPSQRLPALGARVRLLAREAGRATDLTRLGEIVAKLPEGTKGFLAETPRIVQMVGEITRLQTRLNSADRPVFREPYAEALYTAVENFQGRVAGFPEPLASEFRAAAERWREIAARQRDAVRQVVGLEPVTQVFRAGDPVDRDREAFVARDRVVGQLEQQVMLSAGCPGVVLYGRRRMGKSTVLRNLDGFLPPSVVKAVVSMQDADAFTSLGSFCGLVGSRVREVWPGGAPVGGPSGDLQGLGRLLGDCNRALADQQRRLILAFDEYENIDRKVGEGVFPEDLLALVRESIQSHRNLTWVFAGSHEIEELTSAPWTSYLVSARTVEVPPFTEDETRLLLTDPLKYATIWPHDRKRPHFAPEFWGENGVARVHSEAGGWPHLVQLIAEVVVDLLNRTGKRQFDDSLWNEALDNAVVRGHNVLYQLLVGENTPLGESDYLFGFRQQETQPPPADATVARLLRRRLLIVPDGDQWRLRAPLFRRWLQQRG